MSSPSLYLGSHCPPNIEAYLDSLLYRTRETSHDFDLVVVDGCTLPFWIRDADRLSITRYDDSIGSGFDRTRGTARVVRRYLRSHDPAEIRQITQPRWHAPGVLYGALESGTTTCTRASRSLFVEYREAPSPVRAWLANNGLGRSVFLADRLYTPAYGGVEPPRWALADLVVEERTVNEDRFSPAAEPRPELFKASTNRVLTVGRVSRRKGTDLLIEVARKLPDHEFVLVGPVGDESLAAEAEAESNVRVHPPVDYADMPGLYTASDIVLSVSRLEWGGVSRAMLEGKATGRPIVALDRAEASAVADAVVPEEPTAIAAAIGRLTQPE
jgi:glycosyltransferase involved in cell wall biosynthesis